VELVGRMVASALRLSATEEKHNEPEAKGSDRGRKLEAVYGPFLEILPPQ
jgi:hypothetical protein